MSRSLLFMKIKFGMFCRNDTHVYESIFLRGGGWTSRLDCALGKVQMHTPRNIPVQWNNKVHKWHPPPSPALRNYYLLLYCTEIYSTGVKGWKQKIVGKHIMLWHGKGSFNIWSNSVHDLIKLVYNFIFLRGIVIIKSGLKNSKNKDDPLFNLFFFRRVYPLLYDALA